MDLDVSSLLKGRVAAVLNISSGGCDESTGAKLLAVLERAGLVNATVTAVAADGIAAALDAAMSNCDVLVLLGGDGTIRAAADRCGAAGIPLIPLPGGTMNMLAHALYGEIGWEQALTETLARPVLRPVSGGRAEGRSFYCVAILGSPTLWADARESIRRFDLPAAVARALNALRRIGGNRLTYRMNDGLKGSAEAVAVICPLVSRSSKAADQTLEVAALDPAGATEAFGLALHAMFDDWRYDPSVALAKVTTVKVTGHGRIPVILDGETLDFNRAVTITFQPKAFHAITPAPPA